MLLWCWGLAAFGNSLVLLPGCESLDDIWRDGLTTLELLLGIASESNAAAYSTLLRTSKSLERVGSPAAPITKLLDAASGFCALPLLVWQLSCGPRAFRCGYSNLASLRWLCAYLDGLPDLSCLSVYSLVVWSSRKLWYGYGAS